MIASASFPGDDPLSSEGAAACVSSAPIRIVSVRLDQDEILVDALIPLLSDAERATAARFHFDKDRCRFVITRGHLREVLGAELAMEPAAIELEYSPFGKPRLSRTCTDAGLSFNVSHSHDLAIIGTSYAGEIGVDVEALRQIEDADDVARQFFSQRENQEYSLVLPDDKVAAFFNCWTRKEALVKALGQGLSYPLDSFDVSLAPGEPACLRRLGDSFGAECGWHLQSFVPAVGFVGALAIKCAGSAPSVRLEYPNRRPPLRTHPRSRVPPAGAVGRS